MTSLDSGHFLSRVRGGLAMNVPQHSTSTRSPVLAILASLVAGAVLAVALLLGPASGASEPMITGSVMFAFGLGWGLMALLSTRYSAQPQTWMVVPAMFLGIIGLGLMVFQPGPAAMDLLSWIWPPALAILAVWMFMQVRRNLHGRGRWLVVPVIATLLLIAVGGALATVSAATGRTAESASGQMVDVGGHRLYIECTGSGSPTVVLQAGLGASSSSWAGIAPNVAASTTVCAYDRAGHGRSEEAAGPQDGIALATDLHTLLERAGVAGPYVLVAHSSGGPYVRVFAARYPDQVAGMVLLDAQPAEAFTALPDYPGFYQMYRFATALAPSLARVGLVGLLLGLPADESSPSAARSARDAVAELPIALEQAKALTTLGDRPLIVVTAASDPDAGWLDAQDRMTGLSANSAHRVIAAATHDSLISGVDSTDIHPGDHGRHRIDPSRDAGPVNVPGVELTVVAAVIATGLFVAMAAFQATLAAGAPVGAHVLGGRHSGVLPPRLRAFSGIAALLLVGFALVVLARAGVVGWPAGIAGLLIPASWVIAGFLVLNTLGNLASKSRFERTVLAATTAVLAVLCGFVALTA